LIKYATEIENIIKMKFKEVLVHYMSTCGEVNLLSSTYWWSSGMTKTCRKMISECIMLGCCVFVD